MPGIASRTLRSLAHTGLRLVGQEDRARWAKTALVARERRQAKRRARHHAEATERRQRRESLKLYRPFIRSGDLVFDIGAHVGTRTETFLALGAHVVAVEPQGDCADALRARFANADVTVVEKAVGDREGKGDLLIADASTISSLSSEWIERVKRSGRFTTHKWQSRSVVSITTIDFLIDVHGMPSFCKIDVEGYESMALAGLSRPLPALSFEFTPEYPINTLNSIDRLCKIGTYSFNYSLGEDFKWGHADRLGRARWLDASELQEHLHALPLTANGDIYALHALAPPSQP